MIDVTLTRIGGPGPHSLRTSYVTRKAPALPEVGYSFVVYSAPLTGQGVRMVATTPVLTITPDGFTTRNSTYRLAVGP